MEHIRFTKEDFYELNQICDELIEIKYKNNEVYDIIEKLATLTITLGLEFEILENEVFIKDINKYKLIKRKAKIGDIVQIINPSETTPFNQRHNKRFFKVTEEADEELLKWVVDHVVVGNWCLYNDQYVVLEPIE